MGAPMARTRADLERPLGFSHSSEVDLDCPATYLRSMLCLVRGVGDIGSAVAHLVFRKGYAVVRHDEPAPTTTRRDMAFAAEEP
jgi:hypothetical protein